MSADYGNVTGVKAGWLFPLVVWVWVMAFFRYASRIKAIVFIYLLYLQELYLQNLNP